MLIKVVREITTMHPLKINDLISKFTKFYPNRTKNAASNKKDYNDQWPASQLAHV